MDRFRQRCQNEHQARAGKCPISIGRNVFLVPPLVESTVHAYSMQPAYTMYPSNRLVIRNDNTKDTCCTLPLYDSSTVNTNCSEEIQV
jgi:hypothetical protein